MARWRLPLLSLTLAACGLNAVGVVIDDVTPGPDASVGADGSPLPDGPLVNGDGPVGTTEGGGNDSAADVDTADGSSTADTSTGSDASVDADASADADAVADAKADADASVDAALPPSTIAIASGLTGLTTLTRVASFLYAGTSGQTQRLGLTIGQPVTNIPSMDRANALNTDSNATQLFFTTDDRIGTYQPPTITARTNLPAGTDIILAGTRLVVSQGSAVRAYDSGPLFSNDTNLAPTPSGEAQGLAYGSPYVYWADRKKDIIYRGNTTSAASAYVTGITTPTSVAVDNTNLYFATSTSISYVALASPSNVQTIASGQLTPVALIADATNLYWIEAGSGALHRSPKGPGTVETLVQGKGALPNVPYTRLIAVDSQFIYWAQPAMGMVLRTDR